MAITGAEIIARNLRLAGVECIFGIVGIPIVEVADACIVEGIRFIAFRNEQSASYAASIYGYLTRKPGVLLVVGGPGLVHSLAGIYNSSSNKWPMLILAGSVDTSDRHKGGFQEMDQVSLMSKLPFVKMSMELNKINDFERKLFDGMKTSVSGVQGACYIDLPADVIHFITSKSVEEVYMNSFQRSPLSLEKHLPEPALITKASQLIREAKFPLVIIGKGASNYSNELRDFVDTHHLPFIPTPMGKGIVSDLSDFNLSAARSKALAESDVVLVVGARLNWILHFGEYPRFRKDVKFLHIDNDSSELSRSTVPLKGDIGLTIMELDHLLDDYKYSNVPGVVSKSKSDNLKRQLSKEVILRGYKGLLSHTQALTIIRNRLREFQDNIVFVSEGAKTMDFSRTSFELTLPKQRLDAGTNATMGVGLGYAICAKVALPTKYVVAIEGDSAIGFSFMEIETAVRNGLSMLIIVLNNSGIYHGIANTEKDYHTKKQTSPMPSTSLSYGTRYDLLCKSLGGTGYFAKDYRELEICMQSAVSDVFFHSKVSLVNVMIQSNLEEKLQFGWQRKNKKEEKL